MERHGPFHPRRPDRFLRLNERPKSWRSNGWRSAIRLGVVKAAEVVMVGEGGGSANARRLAVEVGLDQAAEFVVVAGVAGRWVAVRGQASRGRIVR